MRSSENYGESLLLDGLLKKIRALNGLLNAWWVRLLIVNTILFVFSYFG